MEVTINIKKPVEVKEEDDEQYNDLYEAFNQHDTRLYELKSLIDSHVKSLNDSLNTLMNNQLKLDRKIEQIENNFLSCKTI